MCRKPIKRMQMLIFIMMLKRTWQDQKRLHMSIDQHGNLRPHSRHQPLIQHASSFQATWTSWELPWTNSHEGKARIEVFIIRVRTLRSHANCRQPNFMLFTVCRIRCPSMLDQYIGECMVSTNNIMTRTKIVIPLTYWYLVDITRWKTLCILKFRNDTILMPYSYQDNFT